MSFITGRTLGAVVAAAAVIGLSACSSGSTDSTSDAGPGDDASAAVTAAADELSVGTFASPSGLAGSPEPGKNVWVISCGQYSISCSIPSNAAKKAAETAGWQTTLFDGKTDPALYQAGIRQAVAAGADGIIMFSIDCSTVDAPLKEALAQGVSVSSIYGLGCEDFVGQPGFSTESWAAGYTTDEAFVEYGKAKAVWTLARIGGTGTVVDLHNNEFPIFKAIDRGFKAGMKTYCPSCKVVDVSFSVTDEGPGITQKLNQVFLRTPDAKAVHVPYDGLVIAGVDTAVRGRSGSPLQVIGGEAYPPNVKLMQQGQVQTGAVGLAEVGAGWLGAANLNNLLTGVDQGTNGLGWQAVAKGVNLPASGDWNPPVDYAAEVMKAWGK